MCSFSVVDNLIGVLDQRQSIFRFFAMLRMTHTYVFKTNRGNYVIKISHITGIQNLSR